MPANVIMSSSERRSSAGPEQLSISWLRGYGVPSHPCGLSPGSTEVPAAVKFADYSSLHAAFAATADMEFWDVQVVRRRHVMRLRLSGLTLDPACGVGPLPVSADLLFHIL